MHTHCTHVRLFKPLVSLFALALAGMPQGWCAVAPGDLVDAIEKAEIIPKGSPITAAQDHEQAVVSTFKNKRANDNDCKIDAVLIARALMDGFPEQVTRVTVYFYNTTLSKYKEVAVSAGDVKAFASGAESKDQLLSSLTIRESQVTDSGSKLARYLDSSTTLRSNRPIQTRVNGNLLEITSTIEPWVGERDLKLEAIRIADRASEVSSPTVRKIRISFIDTANPNKIRQIDMDVQALTSLQNNIQTLLQPVQIAEVKAGSSSYQDVVAGKEQGPSKVDVQTLEAIAGYMQDERGKLVEKIRALDKLGVGVVPFVDSFLAIEETVKNGEENKATDMISRLTAVLEEQEKTHKLAQEFKPEPVKKTNAPPPAATPSQTQVDTGPSIDGPADFGPHIAANLLANHKMWMAYYAHRWNRKGHTPEDFPNYLKLVQFCGVTLRKANRIAEAEVYEKQAVEIQKHQQQMVAAKKAGDKKKDAEQKTDDGQDDKQKAD